MKKYGTRSQILSTLKQNEVGKSVPEFCREHGINIRCLDSLKTKQWAYYDNYIQHSPMVQLIIFFKTKIEYNHPIGLCLINRI
jgi:hypothetical protein